MARVAGYQDLRPRSLSRRFSPLSSPLTGRFAGRGPFFLRGHNLHHGLIFTEWRAYLTSLISLARLCLDDTKINLLKTGASDQ